MDQNPARSAAYATCTGLQTLRVIGNFPLATLDSIKIPVSIQDSLPYYLPKILTRKSWIPRDYTGLGGDNFPGVVAPWGGINVLESLR